jgi:signal transduction histidine kinase
VVNVWRPASTPDSNAMLAHELRRRVAALRVAGEAITTLRGQGVDTAGMLELLVDEIEDLDVLAREVLREGRTDQTDADAVAAVQAAARTVATARGVDIRVEAPPAAVVVRASATMLRQAVENLLDNAASHGGAADVEVAVRPDPDRGEVDVVVADRGPEGSGEPRGQGGFGGPQGGPPMGRDPVDRGTDAGAAGLPTASGVRAGHGIGLFLVRRFLDAAGGRSWVAERQGGGTVVGLSLPLRHGQAVGDRLEDAVNT